MTDKKSNKTVAVPRVVRLYVFVCPFCGYENQSFDIANECCGNCEAEIKITFIGEKQYD